MRWDEANRSLWPNSEVHEESLPAMPALLLIGVQDKHTTGEARRAMGNNQRHSRDWRASANEQNNPQTDSPPGACC
jgi:hypothetical protein